MSLKLKTALLLTAWLIIILILFNIFIYIFFIRISTKSTIEDIENKAVSLLQKDILHHPEYWDNPSLLNDFLTPNELIRIIARDSSTEREIYSLESLLQKPAHYKTLTDPEYDLFYSNKNGFVVYVQVPIFIEDVQIAMLEIGRDLKSLDNTVQVLFSVLAFTSVGAVLLCIVGGYFYARIIFNPIHRLAHTMEAIQKSGTFRRLEIATSSKKNEISQLGLTFNEMIGRLEHTFEKQKQFLADASHELRTPLTIIESYASLLRRWASNDPKLREEAIEAIHSESVRLKELTKNLLTLADTDEEQRMKWVSFDLIPLVQATAASIQLTFDRMIQIVLPYVGKEPLPMKGDPEKIKQLLIILLDNAIKYSKQPIEVIVEELPRHIRLQINDKGIGISEEDLPHLFDRFYRADKARNRKNGGVGLGLAIAENIVYLHKGTIHFASEVGKGTSVMIQLPRK